MNGDYSIVETVLIQSEIPGKLQVGELPRGSLLVICIFAKSALQIGCLHTLHLSGPSTVSFIALSVVLVSFDLDMVRKWDKQPFCMLFLRWVWLMFLHD